MESPIQYPSVKIGETEYSVRFTLGTMLRLEDQGITMTGIRDYLATAKGISAVLALALGTVTEGTWRCANLEPMEIADAIDFRQMRELGETIATALGKAQPALPAQDPPAQVQ